MKHINHKAIWWFFIKYSQKTFLMLSILIINVVYPYFTNEQGLSYGWKILIVSLIIFFFIFDIIRALLTYHFFGYALTESSLKKEKGVIYKKYITIPYERIQNVEIFRDIVSRLLGLSELRIETSSGVWYECIIPGLRKEDAERLREKLIQKSHRIKNSV